MTTAKRQSRRYGSVLISLLLFGLCLYSVVTTGLNLPKWDWMLISGVTAFIIGIWKSQRIPGELIATLTRLVDRGSLLIDTEGLEQLKTNLENRAEIWSDRGGLIGGIAILIAFLVSFGFRKILLMLIEAVGGYVAGRYLGRMASYGTLRQVLQREALPLKVQPGHLDGASGFKPLGDFYFLQAKVAAIPATYLAAWWVIIPFLQRYSRWRESYLGLLFVAIAFELLAFAVPLWLFHLEMEEKKVHLLKDADNLSRSIFDIEAQLAVDQTSQDREQLKEKLSHFTKRYWDIEQMVTWPVDAKVLRRFSLNNLALFIPLFSKVIGNSVVWQSLGKLVHGMLTTK